MNWRILLALVCLMFTVSLLQAAEKTLLFNSKEQETRYHSLLKDLRCMKCANQSLADSQVGLALDLRNKVYGQVQQGKTEPQIIDYLVTRYGDYVLYKPRFKSSTYLLWFGPLIVWLLGIVILRRVISRRRTEQQGLSAAEQQKLNELLNETGADKNKEAS